MYASHEEVSRRQCRGRLSTDSSIFRRRNRSTPSMRVEAMSPVMFRTRVPGNGFDGSAARATLLAKKVRKQTTRMENSIFISGQARSWIVNPGPKEMDRKNNNHQTFSTQEYSKYSVNHHESTEPGTCQYPNRDQKNLAERLLRQDRWRTHFARQSSDKHGRSLDFCRRQRAPITVVVFVN